MGFSMVTRRESHCRFNFGDASQIVPSQGLPDSRTTRGPRSISLSAAMKPPQYQQPGDVVEVEIENIGILRSKIGAHD